ncbi:3917_t:CDS:2, partial [Funneliformis geosporum]
VTLTQTVMVNKNIESEEDLPCQDPLVIFTGAADKDYFVGNERSGNFVQANKNNLIKSIISVIGKLKISRTNKHLVAKEIERNLVTGDTKSCNQSGENKNDQEEKELELIEKRQRQRAYLPRIEQGHHS